MTNVRRVPTRIDFLLAIIARRIQLSPSKWETAKKRYEVIASTLENPGSPLAENINESYPQGSARIGTAIAAQGQDDQHDVDFICELIRSLGSPEQTLSRFVFALDRGPGSRYHGKVEKKNRCVTVDYGDMHVDITPAVRDSAHPYRSSTIPDRKQKTSVLSNPEGFATWVEGSLEGTATLVEFVGDLVHFVEPAVGRGLGSIQAEIEPLSNPSPVERKPMPIVALQLVKRWRNVRYERRTGRKPPSILLTRWVVDDLAARKGRGGLLSSLVESVDGMIVRISQAESLGALVTEANPACQAEALTDRWPGDLESQTVFLDDLIGFREALIILSGEAPLDQKVRVLEQLFGETVSQRAVEDLWLREAATDQNGARRIRKGTGAIVTPALVAGPGRESEAMSPHAFHGAVGGRRWPSG